MYCRHHCKVTFPSTNKSVYAKVLGQLPDMKESIGLTIRINDAAASRAQETKNVGLRGCEVLGVGYKH